MINQKSKTQNKKIQVKTKKFLIFCCTFSLFVLSFGFVGASTVSDFIVNNQPTYAVPPGTTQLLILDLTLPGTSLTSIKINNAGTVAQYDISQLTIYEDGASAGWDGDETEKVRETSSPFFDAELITDSENFSLSRPRIFVTVNINSNTYTGKTIKPELQINSAVFSNSALTGPTDKKIIGLERMILAGTDTPSVPVSPAVQNGEAISDSTVRWYFTDLSNNEFGFKILDENSNVLVQKDESNLSYLDETGLEPDTEYSGRRIAAFNDRGKSAISELTIFPAVRTLSLPEVEEPSFTETVEAGEETTEIQEPTEEKGGTGGPLSPQELRATIQELQQKLVDLLNQLIQLLQQQISQAQASLFRAFEVFTNWLGTIFR